MRTSFPFALTALVFMGGSSLLQGAPIVFSASGANAASIQPAVDAFRASLGPINPNLAGSFASGRREINWDGVPDAFSAPNALPANFFNANSPRGVVFSTPGTGFQVSANGVVAPIEFGNIDVNYSNLFATFSAQRLFTALGSNVVDVDFFVPGSATPALTNGFGVVFTDVDLASVTGIEYFDALDQSLGTYFTPAVTGNETLSFLGVQFSQGHVVSRARVTSGNQILAAGNLASDLVVMDDFIYGEPAAHPVPVPTTLLLVAVGLCGAMRKIPVSDRSRCLGTRVQRT
jgi:hypothetical protein